MAAVQLLTVSSLLRLVSPRGLYLLGYAWLFGMSFWVTFFGGVIAFKTLSRQNFGALQHKTFPIYFIISIAISSGLIFQWTVTHPNVFAHITRPNVADVAQVYALGTVWLGQFLNFTVVGPMTSKTMAKRFKLEKEEGKIYSDPNATPEMKALNRRFGVLHGISSLFNLFAVIALGFHGLWIGNAGL